MHAAAINLRGGVSPRGIRLRGQSIIEYVLIIAVIGLVIVFAGPGVAGAIRNQFSLVGNTVNSGATGGAEGGGASGGGSAAADSATVQTAVAKDAKDWTLDEQKAVAEDIAAKGESSPAYAKAKAAMDAGTKFTMKLTDGQTLEYRIVGINHDDLADGSGKAGLTFLTTSTGIESRMNATDTNIGGWEKSELRAKMNSGEIWNLMPVDFQSKVKSVVKLTNNLGGSAMYLPKATTTSDKLFLLSGNEIAPNPELASKYPWIAQEGFQYEAFGDNKVNTHDSNAILANGSDWWKRSPSVARSNDFGFVNGGGFPGVCEDASNLCCVCPAFCF